jgi:opacity protein-like surface antigen
VTQAALKSLFLLLVIASIGFAQSFRFGVEGGVPLASAFDTGTASFAFPVAAPIGGWFLQSLTYSSSTKRYTVGATAELGLPFHLAIKADVLYKRLGFNYISVGTLVGTALSATETGGATANSWEIPLMAKYRVSKLGPLQPYVEGGVAFRHLQGVNQTPAPTSIPQLVPPSALSHSFTEGVTAGAGLEFRHLLLPGVFAEIRYTRWTADAFSSPLGGLNSAPNQADLLVGVTF